MRRLLQRACLLVSLAVLALFLNPSPVFAQLSDEQLEVFNNHILYFDTDDSTACASASGPGATDGSNVDRFLQVLAHQESHGNPKAHAPGSSAAGKYQYLTSTWHGSAKANYPPADQYVTADVAPESVQDALAKIEYTKKFKIFNSDLFKLALSHFYPAALSDPSKLDALIGSNTITPRQYANSIVNKINSGVGSNIGLHYTEAPDFGTYFAAAEGALPTVQAVAPSAVVTDCGGSRVSGDCGANGLRVPEGGSGVNVCYFNQSEVGQRVGNSPYNWAGCGCEPTSTLMIRATYEKQPDMSPMEVLNGVKAAGAVVGGCEGAFPINWMSKYFTPLGYKVVKVKDRTEGPTTDSTLVKVKDLLSQGYVMMAHTGKNSPKPSVDSAGTTPTPGHYLLVHGVDAQGNFYVANPGAKADNGKAVTPDRMKTWLDEFYAVKK